MVVCNTVGDNTNKKIKALCEYKEWKMVQLKDGIVLGEIIGRDNCKILGLTDKNLVKGILELSDIFCHNE